MARKKGEDRAGGDDLALTGEPAEISDEPAGVIARAAAIDVAKDPEMVCTRVPREPGGGRRVQRTWQVSARYAEIVALMAELAATGVQRLAPESTSDYQRIWYYLAEAAGLETWLVNARDVKHLPGRPETGKLDCVRPCTLNERGMLRPSFVPPEEIRDLRALTRLRVTLTAECSRHKQRAEKVLEDAQLTELAEVVVVSGVPGETRAVRFAARDHRWGWPAGLVVFGGAARWCA